MKKRVVYLKIDDRTYGSKDGSSPFNISFNVSYFGNTLVPVAGRFVIDNLDKDHIEYITTNTSLFQERRRKIEFYCGYSDNVQKIFDGVIEKAQPSGQPDTSVTIDAWTSLYSMGEEAKIEASNTTLAQLLDNAISKCGLSLNMPAKIRQSQVLQQTIKNFSFTGSAYAYLCRVIQDITGCDVVSNQIVFTVENGMVSASYIDEKKAPVIEVNANRGLVGIPEPNAAGIDLRVLLDVSLHGGQTINLKSQIVPLYNGLYNIYSVTHFGSSRGKEFYTDLSCTRVYKE